MAIITVRMTKTIARRTKREFRHLNEISMKNLRAGNQYIPASVAYHLFCAMQIHKIALLSSHLPSQPTEGDNFWSADQPPGVVLLQGYLYSIVYLPGSSIVLNAVIEMYRF